jgi:polyisoprenoid-binding protein YceI
MKKLGLLLLLIWAMSIPASAVEYNVDKAAKNVAKFVSQAPLDEFEGVTDKIDGYIKWEGNQIPPDQTAWKSCRIYLEVELNGLDTGIGLRNRHMRENYLETIKFPYAHFDAHLTDLKKVSDTLYTTTAEGTFNIHGVDKPLTTQATVASGPTGLHVLCNFDVRLSDYSIKIPKLMFMKLNELINVRLDFFLKPVTDK